MAFIVVLPLLGKVAIDGVALAAGAFVVGGGAMLGARALANRREPGIFEAPRGGGRRARVNAHKGTTCPSGGQQGGGDNKGGGGTSGKGGAGNSGGDGGATGGSSGGPPPNEDGLKMLKKEYPAAFLRRKDLVAFLRSIGYTSIRTTGDHEIFHNDEWDHSVSVPLSCDGKRGTIMSILNNVFGLSSRGQK